MQRSRSLRPMVHFLAIVMMATCLLPAIASRANAQQSTGSTAGGSRGGGGGGSGGIGTGIAIGIGIGIINKLAQDAEKKKKQKKAEPKRKKPPTKVVRTPPREKPKAKTASKPRRPPGASDGKPSKPQPDTGRTPESTKPPAIDVACLGGRFLRGTCLCPAGTLRRDVAKIGHFCAFVLVDAFDRTTPPTPPGGARGDTPLLVAPPPPSPPPPIRRGTPAPPPPTPPAAAAAAADPFVPDEVLVEIAGGAPDITAAALAQDFQLTLLDQANLLQVGVRLARYRITDGRSVPQVLASLAGDARALAPQPNYLYRPQGPGDDATPSAYSALQYGFHKISAATAHRRATGRGVAVAVIDTGIDVDHPDLAGAVVERYNATDAPDAASPPSRGRGAHATAIAGIIAAKGIVRGVAPDARLLDVRAFARGSQGTLEATSFWLAKGLDWSLDKGARVVNMSLAGPREPLLAKAVAAAAARDAIIVAAAGNGGSKAPPAYPGAYPGVIAVTATDPDDRLFAQANHGSYIALSAPGVDIFTLAPGKAHDVQSGTSMAAAHVSGMIALLLQGNPRLPRADVRNAVTESAIDLGKPGPDELFGAGRGDAEKALALVFRDNRQGRR